MTIVTPAVKPARPFFSSGPCAKPPGWRPEKLQTESLGRSHRAKIGKSRLQLAIDLMREVLQVPDTHRIGIVPGSDTGAIEMAMWTMLGARPVTMISAHYWAVFTNQFRPLKQASSRLSTAEAHSFEFSHALPAAPSSYP